MENTVFIESAVRILCQEASAIHANFGANERYSALLSSIEDILRFLVANCPDTAFQLIDGPIDFYFKDISIVHYGQLKSISDMFWAKFHHGI